MNKKDTLFTYLLIGNNNNDPRVRLGWREKQTRWTEDSLQMVCVSKGKELQNTPQQE